MANAFMTRWERPKPHLEAGGGERRTESAGYIPPQKQIEQFILAGQRLNAARKEMYDFPDGKEVDPNFYDPTRSPNFDMADASAMLKPAVERVEASVKEVQNLEKEKKLQEQKEFEDYRKSKNSNEAKEEKKD